MSAAHRPPRLALRLLRYAARRWPEEVRAESHRAWIAEVHALAADPDAGRRSRTWQALRFSASLAVRRPAPSSGPVTPVTAAPRPARELLGAAIGVAVFGTAAALLLVHLPAAVADRLPRSDGGDVLHRLPLLALVPVLAAVGVGAGRRLARRDAPAGVARTVLVIVLGWCCARLLPLFGTMVSALPGLALWAGGLWAAAHLTVRLARRPRGPLPWAALAVGVLALVDLAVISAVWLGLDAGDAPRAFALSWFPGVLLEPAVRLPMGTGVTGDPAGGVILDTVEFLPHGLIVTSAFALAYLHAAAARAVGRRAPEPRPA